MMKELESTVMSGGEGGFHGAMEAMMQQLMTPEILAEPLRGLQEKVGDGFCWFLVPALACQKQKHHPARTIRHLPAATEMHQRVFGGLWWPEHRFCIKISSIVRLDATIAGLWPAASRVTERNGARIGRRRRWTSHIPRNEWWQLQFDVTNYK